MLQNGCVGGIVSYFDSDNAIVENCYNIGNIEEQEIMTDYDHGELRGGILGTQGFSWNITDNATVNNCYYLDTASTYLMCKWNDTTKKYERYDTNKVTSEELMGLASTLGSEWTNDVKDDATGNWKYNNGYPILKWQAK